MGRPREDQLEIKVHPGRGGPSSRPRPPPPRRPYEPFKSWIPWLVPTIFMVNVVVFIMSMYLNNCPRNSTDCIGQSLLGPFAFQSFRENPLLGPSAATLQKMGALVVKRVTENHEVWRIFSCMWLHAGVFHVLANMISLTFVGIRLEQEFGFIRIGLLYFIAGVGGSLMSSLFRKDTISVGASGALFGLLGAMLSELITNWTIYENKISALITLIFIIALNLAVGVLPHVDNFAHLGGFWTGFFIGFVIFVRPQFGYVSQKNSGAGHFPSSSVKSKYKAYQYILLIISLLILVIGFILGFIFVLRGVNGNDYCPWCHYLSCIPTPFWSCVDANCNSSLLGNQVNMTCIPTNKTGSFILQNGNNTLELQKICSHLCS
ncbi:hypothetical protein LIER_35641 [Lithospermum erythrorhizon]|uniref:RHOMBOID-like protein n=1 Tax=Lithospermum erythrorhizon TaxID=34254 RepID=A0AAV3NTW3_LITER